MRILIADDDSTNRIVLEAVMSRFGRVDRCGDGVEAVRAARMALATDEPYDVICMDIMMPTMNGLDALRLIRQEEKSRGRQRASKVIVITCREDGQTIDQAFGELCDAYLFKPIDAGNLITIVECLCEVEETASG